MCLLAPGEELLVVTVAPTTPQSDWGPVTLHTVQTGYLFGQYLSSAKDGTGAAAFLMKQDASFYC